MHDKVAIFALDPGTVSGVARGIFPAESNSVWKGLGQGWHESWEVEGEPTRQGWEIMEEYEEWVGGQSHELLRKKGVIHHAIVIEDFVVRLGTGASSRRELLDPVRVTTACETLCWTRKGLRWAFTTYQQPNLALNFATDARLRKHGLWVKGSDHQRAAIRHLARYYATYLEKRQRVTKGSTRA